MTPPTLLGYLARFASFTMQSEVLCTQGLAYLLEEYEEARAALAREVESRMGIRINDALTWVPEAFQADEGRPDLEARTIDGIPLVKIEAKLGAELLSVQLQSYAKDLLNRNGGQSVLLVLIPRTRAAGIAQVIDKTFPLSGSNLWRVTDGRSTGSVVVSVIFWDELFTALGSGEGGRFRHELEQLQSMYGELVSDFIAPLASAEDLQEWRSSETDFVKLVEQVTARLTTQHRLYPMGTESCEGEESPEREPVEYRRRYVCACAGDAESCFSIGARDSFAEWVTPIWMRFRRDTSGFSRIRDRIKQKRRDLRSLESSGHIWIPLDVPRDVSGEEMIEALVEQAEEVLKVAYQAE